MFVVFNHYNGSAKTHSTIKGNFEMTEVFRSIHQNYEDNFKLLSNLLHDKNLHRSNIETFDDDKNQIKIYLNEIVDKYINGLKNFAEEITNEEIAFLVGFNQQYESVSHGIAKTIELIKIKYEKFIDQTHTDVKTLYKKIEKCFNIDKLNHMLASNLHPHLEYYPIIIYIICAITCLGFSAIFHTFTGMSYKVHKILHRLDMAGISILNFGSSYAVFFYAFYCRPLVSTIYVSILFIACLIVFIVSLGDKIHLHEYVRYKGLMFAFLGLSNVVPFTHLCLLSISASPDNDNMPFNLAFIGVCLMAVLYLTGLAIYVAKFPEKYYPKKFDIWFHSHVIWHLFVMAAAGVHLFNVVYAYKVRKNIHCINC